MELIANRYEIAEEIGAGGAAVVFRARDRSLDVVRAVKLMSLADANEVLRTRMRDEAKAMANLEHPHICRIYDVGVDGEQDFVVMEYVEGGSLQDRLDNSGPMPPEAAISAILQVLAALEHAHAAGIVHRDVKPQNILVDGQGNIRLCDFGIALVTRGDDRRTKTGMAMGSLAYMPPEQRQDARNVDASADQYAAAATLYKLITNKTPVDLYLAPKLSPRWEGVPDAIAEVIRVATAARHTDRYLDVSAFSRALCRALERGREVEIREVEGPHDNEPLIDPFSRRPHRRKNNATWMAIAATALLVLVAGVVVLELQHSIQEARAQHADIEPQPLPDLAGVWNGTWNREIGARLTLSGPADDLTGFMWVPLGKTQLQTKIAGAYDPDLEQLVLRDVGNTTSPGTYIATLDDDTFMFGSFDNQKGGRANFKLIRTGN